MFWWRPRPERSPGAWCCLQPARLQAGFGRLSGTSRGVRLTVQAGDATAPPRVLLERLLRSDELAAGWVDLDVDLSAVGAGDRRLVLTAVSDPAGDPAFVGAWSAPRIVSAAERSARPNIVLISLDTLRADHLSLYGLRETDVAGARRLGARAARRRIPPGRASIGLDAAVALLPFHRARGVSSPRQLQQGRDRLPRPSAFWPSGCSRPATGRRPSPAAGSFTRSTVSPRGSRALPTWAVKGPPAEELEIEPAEGGSLAGPLRVRRRARFRKWRSVPALPAHL